MASNRVQITIGVVVGLVALVIAVAGGALAVVLGSDGALGTGDQTLSTPTSALVASLDDIEGTPQLTTVVGAARLRAAVHADRDVFVGVGRAADVDAYLRGTAVERVDDVDVDPWRLRTHVSTGNDQAAPPASQDIWVVHDTGRSASIDWRLADGNYRLVVMNGDGAPGVRATGRFTMVFPRLFALGLTLLAVGALGVLVGAGLIAHGARRPRRTLETAVR